tara:strand:- start:883 stop:1521 length:639 start_codon:yes stop_codon:yes gene_type:complete
MLPFTLMAKTNILVNGYYHNEKNTELSIPDRVNLEILRVNGLLKMHGIVDFEFALGKMAELNAIDEHVFYDETEGDEASTAYKLIKMNYSSSDKIDFYVRFERPDENNKIKGVAVQGGTFFAALLDPDDRFDTFVHELLHMVGLGSNVANYGNPYVCKGKHTVMEERVLFRESKTLMLSDPKMFGSGVPCGHPDSFDNSRLLRELLLNRFTQ